MNFIAINAIQIPPNRQRQEFDPESLAELMDSIQSKGLFHPIVLRFVQTDEPDPIALLVAGERRMRAIRDLWEIGGSFSFNGQPVPEGHLPFVSLTNLSPLEAEEAELEENIRRADLTWQERAAANARLAKLRTAQAEAAGLPPPTMSAISLEVRGSALGSNLSATSKEIILADHLDNPEIAKAKTAKEAYKILKFQEETRVNQRLAEHVGKTFSAEMHHLVHDDCINWLAKCPDNSFDVILTDPPYGMGAHEFGDSGGMTPGGHKYDDGFDSWKLLMLMFSAESFRVAKPQAHAYIFCDLENFGRLKSMFQDAGWTVFRTPFIWYKPNGMRAPWPDNGPQRKYETILYAIKGGRNTLRLASDVLIYPSDENIGHAAQKPVDLYADLLGRSARPGDTVLDAFCGSGPIFPAANKLQCIATGVEKDQASYGLAIKRIEGLKK
jgi:DNA modification methylase